MDISGSGKGINLLEMTNVMSGRLPSLSTNERIAMPAALFGDKAVVTTSFGATSAGFLHLVSSIVPGITVLNIHHGHETGKLWTSFSNVESDFRSISSPNKPRTSLFNQWLEELECLRLR